MSSTRERLQNMSPAELKAEKRDIANGLMKFVVGFYVLKVVTYLIADFFVEMNRRPLPNAKYRQGYRQETS